MDSVDNLVKRFFISFQAHAVIKIRNIDILCYIDNIIQIKLKFIYFSQTAGVKQTDTPAVFVFKSSSSLLI